MIREAILSDCGQYRYSLSRSWGDSKKFVLFIGLNPSIADASIDDPTVRRLIGFCKIWGYDSLAIGNLFAYRATDPSDMMSADNPIGIDNDEVIMELARAADKIVFCWGSLGGYNDRSMLLANILKPFNSKVCVFGHNKNGEPKHPLYLSYKTKLTELEL